MSELETIHAPVLGEPGDACRACGALLASDQRYCLSCGERRADARVAFRDVLAPERQPVAALEAAASPPRTAGGSRLGAEPGWVPGPGLIVAACVAGLAVVLAAGIVIGRGATDDGSNAPAPVVQLGGTSGAGGAIAAGTGTAGAFAADWPEGQEGWTVALQALGKDGTDPAAVAAAKSAAAGKGAPAVGALDSDDYASLDGGNFVVYSGKFKTKKQAAAAARKLKGAFASATVIHVSTDASDSASAEADAGPSDTPPAKVVSRDKLKSLETLSPKEYSKKAAKLPTTTAVPGKAPPKDDKTGGGGTGFEEIG